MKIALLGPNGQLGTDFQAAADGKMDVTAIGRSQLDVTDTDKVQAVLGELDFDVLINCTSYHKTDEVEDHGAQAIGVNAHGVEALAKACAAKGAKFFHISTDYVFGGNLAHNTPLDEEAPTAPVNVYGASKAFGETLARLSCDQTYIFRVASLFGVAGASGKGGNFVETMIRVGAERGALSVVSDQVMSPTATMDIAAKLVDVLLEDVAPGTYHLVNSGSASWYEFASKIIEMAGVKATVSPCTTADYPTRARRPAYSVLDNGKLSGATSPMPDWQDALSRYLKAKGHIN